MKNLYFFVVLSILFSTNLFAQKNSASFSAAVEKNIKSYINFSNKAYAKKDFEKANFLFDSLVEHTLKGSTFDDFTFKRYNKKKLQLSTIKIPTLLITYASWCVIEKGEIPALNKLAQEYKGRLKIVVLFWDKKQNMKKQARKFDSQIEVCYAHETYAKDFMVVKLLKKTLGFPTSYFMNAEKNIVSIKKRSAKPQYKIDAKKSFESCLLNFSQEINAMLLANSINSRGLVNESF